MDSNDKIFKIIGEPNGPTAYFISNDEKSIDPRSVKKEVISVPRRERDEKIYTLLGENCDIIFCTDETEEDFMFHCPQPFKIFAVDGGGNCFGTIGGLGDIEDDDFPVGYVGHEGQCGRIANSLREFLELAIFYPYWYDVLKFEKMNIKYSLDDLEQEWVKFITNYYENQNEIASILNLTKNETSLQLLIANLKTEPYFIVYGADRDHNPYDNAI